ncbi:MAG: cell division protein FtsA [Bacteroidaceae bacterium]|jgi:cell division protein FtsA|nr:cell division protein FtsA [Bacteroidaceae bacterium]
MATTDKDFMVAIELGSSRISGIAGKKTADGGVQIIAYASVKSDGCIRHGIISNEVKTKQAINEVVKKLEAQLKMCVKRAYVGLGGQSLRSHIALEKKDLLSKASITEQIKESLYDESVKPPYPEYETLINIPLEYKVDSKIVADPVGEFGTSIEAQFLNIIAKESLSNNIRSTVAFNGVDIVDMPIQIKCLADNITSDVEKSSGCAVVDLGAETTSVIVYKNKTERYLVVIPLGVATITKDIMSIKQVEEDEAESIKIKFGDAYPDYVVAEGEEKQRTYRTADGRNIEIIELQKIIEARMREIVTNVFAQILKSGLADNLLSGIILAGGGSNMKNITKLFEEMYKESIKQEQVKVRVASKLLIPVTKASGVGLSLDSNTSNTLVSILVKGDTPCGGDIKDNNLFDNAAAAEAAAQRSKELDEENKAIEKLKEMNEEIRKAVDQLNDMKRQLAKNLKDKKLLKKANEVFDSAEVPEECKNALAVIEGKDKYKTQKKETEDLIAVFEKAEDELEMKIQEAKKAGSLLGRLQGMMKDLLNDEN